MKSAHLPLVVTTPYAAALREKALMLSTKAKLAISSNSANSEDSKANVDPNVANTTVPKDSNSMDVVDSNNTHVAVKAEPNSNVENPSPPSDELWVLQRQVRAALVKQHITTVSAIAPSPANPNTTVNTIHLPIALGPTNYATDLIAYRNFYRTRKQLRRDIRAWEKEERRRRLEQEDKRKKKALEYHKAILAHREDFFRFHKNKRSGRVLLECCVNVVSWTIFLSHLTYLFLTQLSMLTRFLIIQCCHSYPIFYFFPCRMLQDGSGGEIAHRKLGCSQGKRRGQG